MHFPFLIHWSHPLQGWTALGHAADKDHTEIVNLLKEAGTRE